MEFRPPKHLTGREIGLWYRNKAREKRKQLNEQNPNENNRQNRKKEEKKRNIKLINSVSIPSDVIKKVKDILQYANNKNLEPFSIKFEQYYNKILSTSFEEYAENELKSYETVNNDKVEAEDLILFNNLEKLKNDPDFKDILRKRLKLPIFEKYDEILNYILDNQIILISGDTGCGKTTQIPQFILDYYIENKKGTQCNIFCTQPRRISAITVAERVAWERRELLGVSVGYQIRLESVLPRLNGSITYCTTGVLLRRMERDPLLNGVTHIVLDEIHERDVDTDILLTLLKKVHNLRKDLKIILMSATFSKESFSKYFNNCPIIEVHGTLFPIEELYLEDVIEEIRFFNFEEARNKRRYKKYDMRRQNDFSHFIEPYARSISKDYCERTIRTISNYISEEFNIDLVTNLIFHITATKPDGAILVFLPGYDKISTLYNEIVESRFYKTRNMIVYTLHSMLPTVEQKEIFEKPRPGCRKIILSTNIAETSITIDDVVYVIDSGKMKITDYDKERNIQSLDEKWISIANSQQRRGRAGRVQSGICYHLFTRAREMTFDRFPKPEILRTKLDGIILNIKMLRINDVENFLQTMLDVPSIVTLKNSINLLKRISALDENEKLTPLGLHLARLPMDPQMGKMCLMASIFHCIDPITTVAASLSFKDVFNKPMGKEKQVNEIRKNFSNDTKSDHLMFGNVIENFRILNSWPAKRDFCYEHFLSISKLNQLEKMKTQFCQMLHDASFLHSPNPEDTKDNINSTNGKLLRAILCAGLYPNVVFLKKIRQVKNQVDVVHHLITAEDGKVEFHPSSVNYKEREFDSRFFVYCTKQKSKMLYIFDSTMVYPLSLLIFSDDIQSGVKPQGKHYLSIANKFGFECDLESKELIMELRKGLQLLLQKKALHPSPIDENTSDDMLLLALIYLFSKEGRMSFKNNESNNESDNENE